MIAKGGRGGRGGLGGKALTSIVINHSQFGTGATFLVGKQLKGTNGSDSGVTNFQSGTVQIGIL